MVNFPLPLTEIPRSCEMLISAQSLMEILGEENTRILDCRYSLNDHGFGSASYRQGHIPGAIYLDLAEDLSSPISAETGRHPLPTVNEFSKTVGSWGISTDSIVVTYDDGPGAMAARCWWLLRWFGHQSVYVLDGGLEAWTERGGTLLDGVELYPTTEFAGRQRRNYWTDADTLMEVIDDPVSLIIDARENKRFLEWIPVIRRIGE